MWITILIGLLVPFRPFIGNGLILLAAPIGEINAPLTSEALSWTHIGLMIWGGVAISIITYHIIQYNRFRRSVKRWGEVEDSDKIRNILQLTQDKMGLQNKKIRLITCNFITSSMLTGFFRPVILLPERTFESEELKLIFKHELVHYKRRDLFFKFLSLISISIHWFNPLVYLMNIAMQAEGEASCDEEVLHNSGFEKRHFYAEMMIGMIGTGKSKTFLSTNFYNGEKGTKKRLKFIMDITNKFPKFSYAPLVIILALTILSGSIFAYSEGSAEQEKELEIVQYEEVEDINEPFTPVKEDFTQKYEQSVPSFQINDDQAMPPLPPDNEQMAPQSPSPELGIPPQSLEQGLEMSPQLPDSGPEAPPESPDPGPEAPPEFPDPGPETPPESPDSGPETPPESPDSGPETPPESPDLWPEAPPESPEPGPEAPPELPDLWPAPPDEECDDDYDEDCD